MATDEKETKQEKTEEKTTETTKEEKSVEETTTEPVTKPKSREPKEERIGMAYIYSSSNNTIVHITDMAGNTISRISGGMITKHSRLKANPTIAMFVAKRAAEKAKEVGLNALYVRMKGKTNSPGTGPGSHSAVKALDKEGLKIISILDTTKVPRGGPKKKGGKRGRRV